MRVGRVGVYDGGGAGRGIGWGNGYNGDRAGTGWAGMGMGVWCVDITSEFNAVCQSPSSQKKQKQNNSVFFKHWNVGHNLKEAVYNEEKRLSVSSASRAQQCIMMNSLGQPD